LPKQFKCNYVCDVCWLPFKIIAEQTVFGIIFGKF
jgi:hypothetical protein